MSDPLPDDRAHEPEPGVEREPDYRVTLANERTVLAWMRTSVGLLLVGMGTLALPPFVVPGAREVIAATFLLPAAAAAIIGVLRWRGTERAVRRGQPLPSRTGGPGLVATGVILAGLIVLAVLFLVAAP